MSDADPLASMVVAARTLLALVFIGAAVGKLRDRDAFHGVVHAYRLLPAWLVGPVAAMLPFLEIGIGLLLPTGVMPLEVGGLAGILLLAFACAMAVNILRGRREIDCGCFHGRAAKHLSWSGVLRTGGLGATAIVAMRPAFVTPFDAMQGLAAGGILFLLFMAMSLLPTFGRRAPRISL